MTKPSFFIMGAPKSGTTALYTYLKANPAIFMPKIKEPNFFSADFPRNAKVSTLADYESLFVDAPAAAVCGEASIWYLYSRLAAEAILSYAPEARMIVLLRNPVEMLPAMHEQAVFALIEDETDFAQAWALEDQRRSGQRLPRRHRGPELLYYRAIASYGEQLERLFAVAGRDAVKVFLFEDFKADPATVYAEVLSFIGAPHDGRSEFPRVNDAKRARANWLTRLVMYPPFPLNVAKSAVKRVLRLEDGQVGRLVYEANRKTRPRPGLSAELKADIQRVYADDIAKLETLIGRDLSAWRI